MKNSQTQLLKKLFLSSCLLLSSQALLAVEKNDLKNSYLLESKGKYMDAMAPVQNLLDSDKSSAEFANLRMGWLYFLTKNFNQSITYYKKALQLNAESIDAKLGISLVMQAQLRWKESASYALQVLEKAPSNYTAHLRLMISYSAQRKWSKLKKYAQKVVRLYPTQASPFVFLARSQVYSGNKEQAIKSYNAVLLRAPENLEAKIYLTSAN